MDRGPLDDVYFTEDFPVLIEIARWDLGERLTPILRPELLAKDTGRPPEAVYRSVGRLYNAGYIQAQRMGLSTGDYYIIERLTTLGLQEVGAWPKPEALASRLQAWLEHEATAADVSDPERASKVRAVLGALGDLGTSFTAKLAAEILKG